MKRLMIRALLLGAMFVVASGFAHAETKPIDSKSRVSIAEGMFAERCKKSGEFIHRTVEGAEGVFLLKLRPDKINYGDQFRMDDPYGRDLGGDGYILSFINGFYNATVSRPKDAPKLADAHIGYRYVEALDSADSKRYRYTGRLEEPWRTDKSYLKGYTRFVLDKVLAPGAAPRYGVTYDDISTREEREYWIAGSSLRVIDLKTNEVIAERIGYMMDRGQGNKSGGRTPWLWAADNACPNFGARDGSFGQTFQTEKFIEKVLKPKGGN